VVGGRQPLDLAPLIDGRRPGHSPDQHTGAQGRVRSRDAQRQALVLIPEPFGENSSSRPAAGILVIDFLQGHVAVRAIRPEIDLLLGLGQ